MSIVQLAPGGAVQAPPGALVVRLTGADQAELVLLNEGGDVVAPDFRKAPGEVVLLPREALLITARNPQGPFPHGTRLGVSFRGANGGGEVVRPPAEVSGQQSATLARIDADGVLHDGFSGGRAARRDGLLARSWARDGSYGYHVHHREAGTASWSLVLDASAAALVEGRRPGLGRLAEVLIGIVSTACSAEPSKVLLATEPVRDIAAELDRDAIDWDAALGGEPAPWPRVTHAARAAGTEVVVVVLEGVPVDYRELAAWAAETATQVLVVAVGRSKHGLLAKDRPGQFWEEELAGLDELAGVPGVRVVATTDLAAAAASAAELAVALFPVRSGA